MRHIIARAGLALAAVLFVTSCSFETPTEVALRGGPSLAVPAGNRVTALSEVWDVDAALDEAVGGDDSGLRRVDTADGEPLALALEKSLLNVSVDEFSSNNLSLDDLNQAIEVNYTVPEINFAGESFDSNIDPIEVPAGVGIPTETLGSIPEVNGSSTPPVETITADGFESITFEAGTLQATPTVTDADSSVTSLTISGARILTTDGTEIATASNSVDAVGTGALDFPVAGAELPANFDVELTLDMSTSSPGSNFDLALAFGFSNDTRISGASGIDFTQTVTGEYTIELGDDLDFQDATVGVGSLGVNNSYPTDWNGITLIADPLELSQGGATKAGPTGAPIDLAGVTLTNENILVAYTFEVQGTDAEFSLDPDADEITSEITGGIEEFSEVNVSESSFDTVESFSADIDQDTQDLVDWVLFVNPVLELTLDNQLGTDVAVNITSTTLSGGNPVTFANLADTSASTSTAIFPNEANNSRSWNIAPNSVGSEFAIDMAALDVDVALSFVDDTPNDGIATLTDVTPGGALSLTGEVAAAFEVDAIQIASETISGQFPEAGADGLDFSQISDFLPDGVEFNGIASSLLVDAGDPDDPDAKISIYLAAEYVDSDGNPQTRPLIEDADNPGATKEFDSGEEAPLIGLEDVINSGPSDLFFDYTVTVAEVTISDPGQRIGADLTGAIPLSFSVNEGEYPNGVELLDDEGEPIVPVQEDDLFGRAADESTALDDIIDSLDSMTLHVDIENSIGFNGKLVIEHANDQGEVFREELRLDSESQEITVSGADLDIIKSFPFTPTTTAFMTPGQHSVNTGGDLGISLWFEVDTDLDLNFSLTGEDE